MRKLLRYSLALSAAFALSHAAQAQTTGGVGIGTATPAASALLDLTSTTKGLLAPRMTAADRTNIQNPVAGLLVYQTDGVQPGFWYYTGAAWTYVNPSPAGDNLGNHTATQNLSLGTNLLTGGGTQGLRMSSSGQVGLGGAVPTNWLDIQGEGRVGTHPTGRPLYITGGFDQAANGVEIRHSNASQGVGIGYNSLYAAGSNTNQNLNLLPKGTGSMGIGTTDPAASALVDMNSSSKGMLPPRLTQAQRDAILNPATGLTVYNISAGRLNTYNGYTWTDPVLNVPPGTSAQLTFNYTGGPQIFAVPRGVTSLQVDMAGSQGAGVSCSGCFASGRGGRVQATLAVTPGQILSIEVGAVGYNGGGGGSVPGGGATDIRIGGTALANRVLVAGGGGGAYNTFGYSSVGWPGGGLVGGSYNYGGTQSAGGQDAGTPFQYCYCSPTPAGLGVGGGTSGGSYYSAGGGGGYYGGGAGYYGGGGGGSSYTDPALATNVIHTQGYRSGAGYATISFTQGPEAPNLSLSNATVSQAAGSVMYSDGSKLAGNAGQLYWDQAGTRLGVGTGSPQAKLHVAGDARVDGLGGGGSRMVVADNNGQLSAQALPTDVQQLSKAGSTISLTNGGSVTDSDNQQLSISGSTVSLTNGGSVVLPSGADNLGNHSATQTLTMNDYLLRLRGGTDNLHGLQYYSAPDGPALFGYNGGLLGYNKGDGNGIITALRWANNGYVGLGDGVTSTPSNRLDIRLEPRGGSHATNRALYVTGNFEDASNGVEFRHSNGTQGVGIGFNSLYAAGSNTNQSLNLVPKGTGGVGIGTTSPGALLDVNGSQLVRGGLSFGASTRQMINLFNDDYGIGVQGGTQYFRTGDAFAWFKSGTHNDAQFNAGSGGSLQMVLNAAGNLGLGTNNPTVKLDIPYGSVRLPGANGSDTWFNYPGNNQNYLRGTTILADNGGNVGIGTGSPTFPLDVQSVVTPGNYAYAFYAYSGGPYTGSTGSNSGPVSIRATGRILATEFNATSDRRLKNVIGLSDNAADLALLNKLRITDYTMRDRAAYGARQFKKVIAQEVEQVFPQAVNQHSGFLPDVYANAVKAEAQADSLLVLTLPAAPATAAKAGQRLKLIAKTGEVVGTVKAANGATLVVRGARQLAGQKVFVFGLEHADVRTVDYEALSMLNVSATQELARKVAALEAQNAALRQQSQQQQQALRALQTETTATTTSLSERLKALENMLGAKAEAK
ncbi:tail fiber domain-containing protein [Hymenobacter sp. M29]|uniref:receptor protein-tyrosine kinase n=1 Tax=Hymenobacter mellowenesis TaxID=3063995 RepID=A0ABT9A7I0_9BACT|nr:tail fiber domain-containing protein [Hymenobacter sp. M29]MDO7845789.1 tail fiber domain-containing protein [Hymenobacter sp. M29]